MHVHIIMQSCSLDLLITVRTYDSLREAGAWANERNILKTSLMNGKITHWREREREICINGIKKVTNSSMQPMEAAK